ncbi:DNA-directed RNA polymerase subunit D, partial [mine drainage metagenome]
FRKRSECTCNGAGCPSCQVMYSIDRKGPCTVYARDVVPLGDPTLAIIEPEIPIVRLGAKQALLAYATAVVGTAREHAKWQVALAVGLSSPVEVQVSKKANCSEACLKRAVESLPDGVASFSDGKITILDETKSSLTAGIEEACPHGSIKLVWANDRFFFRFETDGSLTARDALRYALKDLKSRFEDLREAVQAIA